MAGWRDARRVVAAVTVAVLLFVAVVAGALRASMLHERESLLHVSMTLGPPADQLLEAERSNVESQEALNSAVAAIGSERDGLLSDSILAAQATSASWKKYRSLAVGLPGEAELVDRYVAHQKAAQKTSTDGLIPILRSTQPGNLPKTQIATHQAVARDLEDLHALYRAEDRASLGDLRSEVDGTLRWVDASAIVVLGVILVVGGLAMGRAQRLTRARVERYGARRLAAFDARLRRALELVDEPTDAFRVADRAMREAAPDARTSLLVADASRAMLAAVDDAPVCGVSSPQSCPALRTASTVTVADSASLDACPVLTAHSEERCSATCVPVTIAGSAAAVIHVVGPAGLLLDGDGSAGLIARGVGERVTLLQALATFQLQAERDPLTGLLNRRSFRSAVGRVALDGGPFAVAFCDLDHFKRLNDLHGHDAGDRALRFFSRTLVDSLRPEDVICRWGGEEFIVVLPGCDEALAEEAMERVRQNLADRSSSELPATFTASFGVAVAAPDMNFDSVVERADTALHEAKANGRDRIVRYSELPQRSTSSTVANP